MAIVDRKGRVLTESQVKTIIKMMQNSLQSRMNESQDEKRLAKLEKDFAKLAKSKKEVSAEMLLRDENRSMKISDKSFKLLDEPMEGIEKIPEFNPDTDGINPLHLLRAGNSDTLALDDVDVRNRELSKLTRAAELSRRVASKLRNSKGGHTFEEVYNVFSEVKEFGGRCAPEVMFRTMTDIADYMNEIDETEDEKLKKTRAIQLAAFVYQMVLAEHLYEDGNDGSGCLLADVILQAYGLPPHIPQKKETEIVESIESDEEEIDFLEGAVVIMKGVEDYGGFVLEEKDYVSLEAEDRMQEDGQTIGKILMKYKAEDVKVDNKVYDEIEQITRIANTYPDNEYLHIACEETLQAMLQRVAEAKAEKLIEGIAKCYAKEVEHIIKKGTEAKRAVGHVTKQEEVASRGQGPIELGAEPSSHK